MRRTGPDRSGPYACNYLNGPDPQPFLQSDRALFCLITGAKIVITLFIKEKKKKKKGRRTAATHGREMASPQCHWVWCYSADPELF